MKVSNVVLVIHVATWAALASAGAYAMFHTFGLWETVAMYSVGIATTAVWTYAFSKGK